MQGDRESAAILMKNQLQIEKEQKWELINFTFFLNLIHKKFITYFSLNFF